MKTIKVTVKAMEGDSVMVNNYRKKNNFWEEGKVISVSCGISKDGSYRVSYYVMLERQSPVKYRDYTRPIFVTVGDKDIMRIQ